MLKTRITDYVSAQVKNKPNALFLTKIETEANYTYGDLQKVVENYCSFLSNQNLNKGDRILYLANNDWFIFPLIIACSILKFVLVPISPDLHPNDTKKIFNDVKPKILLGYKDKLNNYFYEIDKIDISEIKIEEYPQYIVEDNLGDTDDVILIIYTSGSSGQCKGVMITEANIIHAATSIIEFYKITEQDKFLCILPLYHMNAIMVTGMVPILTGSAIILSDVFNFTNAVLYFKHIKKYHPTVLSLIPSIMFALLKLEPKGINLSELGVRFSFCGAAPLLQTLWKDFEKKCNLPIYQGYGLTETTFWATLTPTDLTKDYTSVGIPYNCDIKIDNKTGEQIGEVLISGPIVSKGYFNNPEGFSNGYLKTGDLGYIGPNRQLYVTGRIKDIIIKNGINIYPQAIDEVLITYPGIDDCASVGIEDEVVGERICTVCVPLKKGDNSINEFKIKAFAKEHLSLYMVPDIVLFCDILPRGQTGKIIRRRLLDLVQEIHLTKKINGLSN
jgi:acyl-CoA synthetase (AMP-forming)/AMP-acid ligase II